MGAGKRERKPKHHGVHVEVSIYNADGGRAVVSGQGTRLVLRD